MNLVDPFSNIQTPADRDPFSQFVVKHLAMVPAQWQAYQNDCVLHWTPVRFQDSDIDSMPDDEGAIGVYTIVLRADVANHPAACCLLYVGKVEKQSFRARFKQYLLEKRRSQRTDRIRIADALTKWEGYLWFYYSTIADASKVHSVEEDLLKSLLPPLNTQFPAVVRDAIAIMR